MSEIAKTFTAAFETVKEHIRYFRSKPDADAAYNGRIVGMEDALSQFRPVMKIIEQAALPQPSASVQELAEVIYTSAVRKEQWHIKAAQAILDKYNVTVKG